MKRYAVVLVMVAAALSLYGCGGGGGSSSPNPAAGKAVAKLYLFGRLSSSCRISSVQASIVVPAGVLVNYSTPAPADYPANVYPLRSGAVVPSGPVLVPASDISGTYDTLHGILSISVLNFPTSGAPVNLRSGVTGDGIEIAQILFNPAAPGTTPTFPNPWVAAQLSVWEEVPPAVGILPLPGCQLNLKPSLQ